MPKDNRVAGEFSSDSIVSFGRNYGTVDISHGSLVAHDVALTDTSALLQYTKRANGMALPTSVNAHRLWGIANAADQRYVQDAGDGEVVEGGLAQALVYIPALTNLVDGVHLAPRFYRGAAATVTPTFSGTLTPVVYGGVLHRAANPVAIVREAYNNAAASAVTKLLWVDVVPHHRPLPFQRSHTQLAAADRAALFMGLLLGPGELSAATLQGLAVVSANTLTASFIHHPLGATADPQVMYTTLPTLGVTNAVAGSIAGPAGGALGAGLNVGLSGPTGDTDVAANNIGDQGTNGVLAALAVRQFTAPGILSLSLAGTPTGGAPLVATVNGLYY